MTRKLADYLYYIKVFKKYLLLINQSNHFLSKNARLFMVPAPQMSVFGIVVNWIFRSLDKMLPRAKCDFSHLLIPASQMWGFKAFVCQTWK